MSESINRERRRLLLAAGVSLAGAIIIPRSISAQPSRSASTTTLGPIKQIDAGVLSVGYADFGPPNGRPVILLHGWPYDVHSFVDVAPLLAAAGYRVIVPHLRGYGSTRFLSGSALRNGQPAAVAVDIVTLMDALNIEKATLAGFVRQAHMAARVTEVVVRRCNVRSKRGVVRQSRSRRHRDP